MFHDAPLTAKAFAKNVFTSNGTEYCMFRSGFLFELRFLHLIFGAQRFCAARSSGAVRPFRHVDVLLLLKPALHTAPILQGGAADRAGDQSHVFQKIVTFGCVHTRASKRCQVAPPHITCINV